MNNVELERQLAIARAEPYARFEETAICQPEKPGDLETIQTPVVVVVTRDTKADLDTARRKVEALVAATLRSLEGRDQGGCYKAQFLRLAPDVAKALEAMEGRNRQRRAVAARETSEQLRRERPVEHFRP
ncbi:MAG: hypothetical protein HY465_05350 [Deltaproteobacteria bacterium]|nr:hypothetical protein [Deltaproteobacteria bacterium]